MQAVPYLPPGWRLDGDGRERVLTVTGDLDINTIGDLGATLEESVAGDAECLVIDLTEVGFTDSMGLRLLVATHQRLEQKGAHLRLRVTPRLYRLLELAGLSELLHTERVESI